ncbi:Hypothetical protein GbCGDNIH4_1369 [Granulibacter bethesdensis CGDNIH4]|nr:Hypothetical protein GbCGDNIH4_1369 [Granulibacter bethesdensis CGDNIH4]
MHQRIVKIGSSPRRRGTQIDASGVNANRRFIPAQAGNTASLVLGGAAPAVHPRAGGEHPTRAGERSDKVGSSPRRRGTPCRYCRV